MDSEQVKLRRKSPNPLGVFDPISAECDECLEDLVHTKGLYDSSSRKDPHRQPQQDQTMVNKTYFVCDKSDSFLVGPQAIPPPMHLLNLDRLMSHQSSSSIENASPTVKETTSPSYLNPILSSFERLLNNSDQGEQRVDPVEHQFPQASASDGYLGNNTLVNNKEISTRDSGFSSHSSNSGQEIPSNFTSSRRRFIKKDLGPNTLSPIEIDFSKYKSLRTTNSKSSESIYDRCENLMNHCEPRLNFRINEALTPTLSTKVSHHSDKTLSPIWKRNPLKVESDFVHPEDLQKVVCVACASLKKFFVFRPTRMLHLERLTNALFLVEQEALKCEHCWRKINQISVNLFNKNPRNGISFYLRNLMSNGAFPNSPESMNRRVKVNRSVSNFIRDNLYQLNTSNVGQFLGQLPFAIKILSGNSETLIHVKISPQKIVRFLMNGLQFNGCEIDEALRIFINKYALPSESQEIDRVIQIFAEVYHASRWTPESPLTENLSPLNVFHVYGIAYAIIILQTSLHNSNAHKKRDSMLKNSLNDFIKSLTTLLSERKDDESETRIRQRLKLYSNKKLKIIYQRIQANPFIFEDRQMTIMHKLRTAFTKSESVRKNTTDGLEDKFNWIISPHRRLVCYCAMYQLDDLQQNYIAKGSPKLRHVFLFNDLIVVAAEISPQLNLDKSLLPNQRLFKPPIELLFDKDYIERFETAPQLVSCMGLTRDLSSRKTPERLFVEVCSFSILGCSVRSEKMSPVPFTISMWQQNSMSNQTEESYWHCLIQLASVTQTDHVRFLKDLNCILFEANLSRTALDIMK